MKIEYSFKRSYAAFYGIIVSFYEFNYKALAEKHRPRKPALRRFFVNFGTFERREF